ncbi:MAG: hypothetical protein CVU97_04555 [Firmicutes bacterium HGW-Firmicutes-21]|nr:MAG: hypothetical protein CVU97_04555 [Firmicutes bacterium HGW-Firmicutes-21]
MKKKHKRSNIIVRFAFGIIFIFLIVSVVNMQYELRDLKDRRVALEEQVQDVEDKIQEINIRLNTPLTSEYIARVAKEKLGYRNPNEIIFYNDIAD